ncbi:MAG TPA: trypsin-like peptidase domain-containing protein [Terriglobales bacterium]|nr:trypsin-like peptidase domain-containing protein [Terriglobales bacterium]
MRSKVNRNLLRGCFLDVLLSVTLLFATTNAQQNDRPSAIPSRATAETRAEKAPGTKAPDSLIQLNGALVALSEKVSQGVVQILVTGYGPLEENSSTETALIVRQRAIGSGVIVDPSGYIMTNAHVVEGARRIRVVLALPANENALLEPEGKRRILEAKVVGTHQESDLALLKVSAQNLPALSLANSRQLRQGQLVFAVGSPEGLQDSVTMGVISSVARQPDPQKPMVYIQTDAAINPGNSGGPLVDVEGNVVGINTSILSGSGGNEGIGFAIPSRVVRFIYDSLRKYGHVHRSEIEVSAQTVTPSLATGLGLKRSWGVIVSDVKPGGPAESAGLKIGDILVSADDRPIETLPAFTAALYLHPVDQVLKLDVLRDGEPRALNVPVLQDRNHMDRLLDVANPDTNLVAPLGILAIGIDENIRSAVAGLRVSSGVIVLGRAADLLGPNIGLTTGDVIHAINNRPVDSVENLRSALSQLKSGDSVALQVERQGKMQFVAFDMD